MPRTALDPLRERLAQCSTSLAAARTRAQRIADAQQRCQDERFAARHRVEDLDAALAEARANAGRVLVGAYLDGAPDATTDVAAIEAKLSTAEQELGRLERVRTALLEQEEIASHELHNASADHRNAIAALLRAAPEVTALRDACWSAQLRLIGLQNALAVIRNRIGKNYPDPELDGLPSGFDHVRGDPAPLEAWSRALAELEQDSTAGLPDVSAARPAN